MSSRKKASKRATYPGFSSEGVHDEILAPKAEFVPHLIEPIVRRTGQRDMVRLLPLA
ncbi:hypothetical protein DY000_02014252 [Brassica cretica]|uniref:Uncharacterized protein n=1 Tax=Brassica cretica TaxID=69181 RepID=A0ABQ7CW97_BRACR|nr:hypothetical protein DY000_02014252 [Brassica cretica]